MNGTDRRIEIFAPFGQAFELMKRILFQPFDIKKWFVIGFAAFLAQLAGGGFHYNFNFKNNFGSANWNMRSFTSDASGAFHSAALWLIPLIAIGAIVAIIVVIALLWVGSRGKFIFTDCVVRNRAEITQPWHEFRREGNSLFKFSLIIAAVFFAIVLLGLVPLVIALISRGDTGDSAGLTIGLILGFIVVISLIVLLAIAWGLVSQFMIPIMYRRRCSATEAFRAAIALIGQHLGPFLLYLLFLIVLGLATSMVACLLTCVTCCITAIPYVGTVVLLPIHVLFAAFPLFFLRQFGPEYDVFATLPAIAATTPLATPPPAAGEPPAPPSPPPAPPPQPPMQA